MSVVWLKQAHVVLAILTFVSFSTRVYWMYRGSAKLHSRAVKVIPHLIDALLLLTGLAVAVMFYGEFYRQPWLLLKLLAVVIYIITGSIALKRGNTMKIRMAAVFGSWGVFVFIVILAWTHGVIPY
jgi:uncharacterized membrane protein SirB2